MTEITKKDLQDLTSAMVEGFQNVQERFDSVENRLGSVEGRLDIVDERLSGLAERQDKFADVLDHVAGRVDDLWTENAAQTISNRRFEVRISRLEEYLGIGALPEEIEV